MAAVGVSTTLTAAPSLTTIFEPPAWCLDNINAVESNGTTIFGLNAQCGETVPECFPGDFPAGSIASLKPLIYSPGVFCPSGYTTAATTAISPQVTGAACCPKGFSPNGVICEGFPDSPLTATGCDGKPSTYSSSVPLTASANMIILAYQSSDVAAAATYTPSTHAPHSTASPTDVAPKFSLNSSVAAPTGFFPHVNLSSGSTASSDADKNTTGISKSGASSHQEKSLGMMVFGTLALTAVAAFAL